MHGLFGSYKTDVTWHTAESEEKPFVKRSFSIGDFYLTQVTLPKFLNDKYFVKVDGCFLATEGVLFEADTPDAAIARYKKGETTFWNSWRGSFAGVLYDEQNDTLLLFNDHIGSKMLFYTRIGERFVFASDPYVLAQAVGAKADNENYLWQMLYYGYSPIGETVFKSIHRLQAGEYIRVSKAKTGRHTYHRFSNEPNRLSVEENIERIDAAFRRAVTRALRKNEQYGYIHYLPLSAGLDSRMTNRVAQDITRTPIHHITYSQTGYYDEHIPRELAAYWQTPIHFTPLDNGECLLALDEVSRRTCGLIQYSGAAETLWGLPEEAREKGGVFLTGMIGERFAGTAYTKKDRNQPYHAGDGAILHEGDQQLEKALPADFGQLYANREIYYYYVRGFNAMNLGSPLIQQSFGESYSPFCDVDFIETALAVPLEQRWNYQLYDQWILCKYPDMTRWKHNGIYTIGHRPKQVCLFGRALPVTEVPKRTLWFLLKKLHIHNFYTESTGRSMNPEDDWFAQNDTLRQWVEEYLNTHMALLDDFPEVRKTAERLSRGTATEWMAVLSLLACLRQAR